MTSNERFMKTYYAKVSSLLLCSSKEKRVILNELRANVTEYLEENKDAGPEDILSMFGTPEQIAESAMHGADPAALKKKTLIKRAVLIAILLALFIWAVFAVVGLIDVHTESHGYYEEGLLSILLSVGGLPL